MFLSTLKLQYKPSINSLIKKRKNSALVWILFLILPCFLKHIFNSSTSSNIQYHGNNRLEKPTLRLF